MGGWVLFWQPEQKESLRSGLGEDWSVAASVGDNDGTEALA